MSSDTRPAFDCNPLCPANSPRDLTRVTAPSNIALPARLYKTPKDPVMTDEAKANQFVEEVFPAELEEVRRRRSTVGDPRELPTDAAKSGPSVDNDLIGLALSGGGIRSASFSLGVVQGLIKAGLFNAVDYLSTVSGGGYTGACLSSLTHRGQNGERLIVDHAGETEPAALNHLRNGSNFLVSGGLLNQLRMPALFIIGVFQTLLLFVPIIIFFVFLSEIFFELSSLTSLGVPRYLLAVLGILPLIGTVFLRPITHSRRLTWQQRNRAEKRAGVFLVLAVISILTIPLLAGLEFLVNSDAENVIRNISESVQYHAQLGIRSTVLWGFIALAILLVIGLIRFRTTVIYWSVGAIAPVILVGFYLICCVYVINSPDVNTATSQNYIAALKGYAKVIDDPESTIDDVIERKKELRTVVNSILKEKQFDPSHYDIDFQSVNPGNVEDSILKISHNHAMIPHKDLLPVYRALSTRHQSDLTLDITSYWDDVVSIPELSILSLRTEWDIYLIAAFLALFNYLFANINHISLHPAYRDRLSKTFLIQPDPDNETTSGDENLISADAIRLSELSQNGSNAPYHLINTALNLQGSSDPQLRQRKTVPFLLSKRFCGSNYTGFCDTKSMEEFDRNLDLGTAMAISAAAAGPMMGAKTVRSLSFIMALLNFRLNYWLPHPGRTHRKTITQWLFRRNPGLLSLMTEASGAVSDRGKFVNCSDGGHIENLGVYELLQRRCKTIICVDGSADPNFEFFDLTTIQRYAQIDMDTKIKIDVTDLLPNKDGISKQHFAVGEIKYHDGTTGVFIYIKLSYSGDESEYVKFYKRKVTSFPHESTSDQFFNETKFEVYRSLGEHITEDLFQQPEIRDRFPA